MAFASTAVLAIKILADSSDAQKALADTAGKAGKFQAGLTKAVAPAAAVTAALAGIGGAAISAASDLQQSQGGVDAVFKGSAGAVHDFAKAAAESAGLSESAYSEMATVIGSQLKNAGTPMDQLAGKTDSLIATGADMAAMFGGTSADAVSALSSALKGEMDPIEKYGVTLNESAIKAQMAADGTDKLTGKQAAAAKQQAILAIITKQSADAQGAFAKESESAAGQQAISNATMANTAATLGTILLPAFTAIVSMMGQFAKWAGENKTLVMALAGVIGGLALTILAVNGAMRAWNAAQKVAAAATKIWTALQWLWNAAMAANPIGLIIVAVLLLIAAVVLLWKKNEGFRNFILAAWAKIQAVITTVWQAIQKVAASVFAWMKGAVSAVGNWFRSVFNSIRAVWATVTAFVRSAFSAAGAVIRSVINSIRSAFAAMGNFIRSALSAIGAVASAVWGRIKSTAASAFGGIKSAISAVKSVVLGVWNAISGAASRAFGTIRSVGASAINALLGPIHAVEGAWNNIVGAVQNVIGWISRISFPSMPDWMPGGASAMAPAASTSAAVAPSARGVRGARGVASNASSGTVINVNGALDPDAVSRQIVMLLQRQNRRRNGADIGRLTAVRGWT